MVFGFVYVLPCVYALSKELLFPIWHEQNTGSIKTAERAAYVVVVVCVVVACVVAACVVVGVFLCSLFPCQRAKLSAAIQLMCLANEYGSEREHCHAGAARRYSV